MNKVNKKLLNIGSCLILASLSTISYANFNNDDSTNIGNFSNCNNFIVHREYVNLEQCPENKDNSYLNERKNMQYLARYVGLNKKINLDFLHNHRILEDVKEHCIFNGHSHNAESTESIHQLLKVRSSDVTYQNCYNSCERAKRLIEEYHEGGIEGKEYIACGNGSNRSYTKKWKKNLTFTNGLTFDKLKDINSLYYLKEVDCEALNLTREETDNSAKHCKKDRYDENDIISRVTKTKDGFVAEIGTIGDNYWGDGEYVRSVDIKALLKQNGLNLDDMKEVTIEQVAMDDWLEVFTSKGSFMSFPYPQFSDLNYCTPNLQRYSPIYYNDSCEERYKTGFSTEMSTSWNITRTKGHGRAPAIAYKNLLDYIDKNRPQNFVTFKTYVGGWGEFYIKLKGVKK